MQALTQRAFSAVAGFGPVKQYFDDPSIEELWINEPGSVMSPVARITNVLGRAAARGEQRALTRPGFSSGDLVTLAAMYPRAGCPATPGVKAS